MRLSLGKRRGRERSAKGHWIAFVLVDYASDIPRPCHDVASPSVADALFHINTRMVILREILTDQGTAFMSCNICKLYELLDNK